MVIFVILIYVRRRAKRPWATLHSYLLLYGLVRFFVEGIRTDSLMFCLFDYNFRVSQVLSAVMVLFSGVFLIAIYVRGRRRDRLVGSLPGVPSDVVEITESASKDEKDE
jgi:prolipoprotein diacylglyceryltransferase